MKHQTEAKLLGFIGLLALIVKTQSVELHCDYSKVIIKSYSCMLFGVKVDATDSLSITGTHLNGKADSDVKYMAFYGSRINEIPNYIFSKFPNLDQLDIQISGVKGIDPDSLKGAKTLKKLHLRGNNVKSLEAETFVEARLLEVIVLHDNVIGAVDQNAFKNLSKLEALFLGDNNIAELHKDTFLDLVNLKELYLHFNKIEKLEEGLFRNNFNLEQVAFDNNKIKVIGAHLFNNLMSLKIVNFAFNTCIDDTFKDDFALLNRHIEKCSEANTLESINQRLLQELDIVSSRITKLNKQVAALGVPEENTNNLGNHALCPIRLHHCKRENRAFNTKVEECQQNNLKLTEEIQEKQNSIIDRQFMNDRLTKNIRESRNAYMVCIQQRTSCEEERKKANH